MQSALEWVLRSVACVFERVPVPLSMLSRCVCLNNYNFVVLDLDDNMLCGWIGCGDGAWCGSSRLVETRPFFVLGMVNILAKRTIALYYKTLCTCKNSLMYVMASSVESSARKCSWNIYIACADVTARR